MVQDCPRCGLVNPPGAQRCDCGYDFASRSMQPSYLGTKAAQDIASPTGMEVFVCLLLPVIGIILGLLARRQGRRLAGRTMLVISGVMLFFWLGVRLLLQATG